ncbi:MAG TPA: flagellar protein FlgN [Candidatus Mailhella merdigallinarum]|uniref:Flagellar protein FlgN n=1 Tax=Candidatus Mailhella merdigallinarum TaxID=2838658 RepID=A0A9D2KKR3_9BACT|nr:flagellar protein FlgN [Candidatus Mailhella merdigallinarum]
MYSLIYGNLDRQAKALTLLGELLDEEFSLLLKHETEAVMGLEFSIHELLRQLAVEKETVIRRLGGGKVLDYAQMLPEEQGEALTELWRRIDAGEQACARRASRNTELSLGLMDQSKRMLDYLHARILPPQQDTYGRRGRYNQPHPAASLFSGRL